MGNSEKVLNILTELNNQSVKKAEISARLDEIKKFSYFIRNYTTILKEFLDSVPSGEEKIGMLFVRGLLDHMEKLVVSGEWSKNCAISSLHPEITSKIKEILDKGEVSGNSL